jgi:small subunit ribosomal protein S18
MARTNDRDRNSKRAPRETRPRGKKRVCVFCKEHSEWVDYKDVSLLRRFMSERGKIRSRRVTGNCTQHQREVQSAIKTAREMALLPYLQRTVNERGPSRPRPPADRPGDAAGPDEAETEEATAYDLEELAEDLPDELPEAEI